MRAPSDLSAQQHFVFDHSCGTPGANEELQIGIEFWVVAISVSEEWLLRGDDWQPRLIDKRSHKGDN